MKNRKQTNTKAHYLIAGAILLAGCAISALILHSGSQAGNDLPPVDEEASSSGASASQSVDQPVDCQIAFYGYDGQLLQEKTVRQGMPILPPALESGTYIFKGWNQDLYAAVGDVKAYPRAEAIPEEKNVLYADAVYASGTQPIAVTLRMAGEVDCADFVITIAYDAKLLAYEGMDSQLATLTVKNDAEQGVLTLTNADSNHLSAPTDLAELRFRALQDGSYQTNLPKTVSEIYTVHNGSKVYTDSTAYDTNLYLLQVEKE